MSSLITMSQKELHRLEVIQKINDRRLSVVLAAELLGLSRSQMHRLLQAYDRSGAAGLVSKKRSRPSNRRHSEDFRNAPLDLIRERYLDFGPTLARELNELHHVGSSHSGRGVRSAVGGAGADLRKGHAVTARSSRLFGGHIEFEMDAVVRKLDTILMPIDDTRIDKCCHVAMNGLHITVHAPGNLADGKRALSGQSLNDGETQGG